MPISTNFCDPLRWAQTQFAGAPLGDQRRSARLVQVAAGWARQPGASIARLSAGQAGASKAAYRLLGNPDLTPDALPSPHRAGVCTSLQEAGTYLLIEDTTEVIWPAASAARGRRAGLGPVGAGKAHQQGVLLHSLVAAGPWPAATAAASASVSAGARRPAVPLVGLLDQQFHVRQPIPPAERATPQAGSRQREHRPRESALWTQSLRAVGTPPPAARWVVVADRGADIYDHLLLCRQQGLGFVVRAAQDRALVDVASQAPAGRLFALVRAQPAHGHFCLALRGRPGQPARDVLLAVSYTPPLAVRSPQRVGSAPGKGPSVGCGAVRVWEETPPPGQAPLEWVLLCDEAVTTFEQAVERSQQYASRWIIEDFHKALKTGMGAEKLQLQTAARLFAAVAVLSVVALALVDLRENSRLQPDAPATAAGLETTHLRVLTALSARPVRTVAEVYLALAALGGHLGRKGDGPPGWQTLWRGLQQLRFVVEGVRIAPEIHNE